MSKTKLKIDQLSVKSFKTNTSSLKGGYSQLFCTQECESGTNYHCPFSVCICD